MWEGCLPSARLYILMNLVEPIDRTWWRRALHIPQISYLLRLRLTTPAQNPEIPLPRFSLFDPLPLPHPTSSLDLTKSMLLKFRWQLCVGLLLTLLWALLNLTTPTVIKQFFLLMKTQSLEAGQLATATFITEKFLLLQLARTMMAAHIGRLFQELSLKTEGVLARKLVEKALRLSGECRRALPESEVYQLENGDLKQVGALVKQGWMVLEIPFTLLAAVIMLFLEKLSYGFVGLYWLVLVFFLQRWLSEKMAASSRVKLRLIEQRAASNYELLEKMRLARLALAEDTLVQRNNDFFLHEMEGHKRFYHYQTLLEVTLLLLPIAVVISIALYDLNEATSFTVKQVYLLLSLLGICYKPLRNLHRVSLATTHAIHSIKRLTIYLNLPENTQPHFIRPNQPQIKIKPRTMTVMRGDTGKAAGAFFFDRGLNLAAGQRLIILGKKGQGTSLCLRSMLGELPIMHGEVSLGGKLAYLPERQYFSTESVKSNIEFYGQPDPAHLQIAYKSLGLERDLSLREGLKEGMQVAKFSESELKRVGLARVLCSDADVYFLDCPFLGLSATDAEQLQLLLRTRQKEGKLVIMTEKYVRFAESKDIVMIIVKGQVKEYGTYKQISSNPNSLLGQFSEARTMALSDKISCLPVVREFQAKIRRMLLVSTLMRQHKRDEEENAKLNKVLKAAVKHSLQLKRQHSTQKAIAQVQKKREGHMAYFELFLASLPGSEWIFLMILILAAELLHVFINYQIGHEYKKGGEIPLHSFRLLLKFEVALTVGLALMVYLQGAVSSAIAVTIGNSIYKRSLEAVVAKELAWYAKTHSPLIANKYNHDYEEIFVAVHYIAGIFRYLVLFLTTISLIDASIYLILLITCVTTLGYSLLLSVYHRAEEVLVRCYAIYKYEFVRVFDEVIEGATLIRIFGRNEAVLEKAKEGFVRVAAYKQAVNSARLVQDLLCELCSTIVIGVGLEYGTIMKVKEGEQNEALVAVTVLLLLNLSEVFRNIISSVIKLESFFRLSLLSFIEVIDLNPPTDVLPSVKPSVSNTLVFHQALLKSKNDPIFEIYPLSLTIPEGQTIMLFEEDSALRNNLLLSLTNNLPDLGGSTQNTDKITIGKVDIRSLSKEQLRAVVGTLLAENFYASGPLIDILSWRIPNFDSKKALRLSTELEIGNEEPDFKQFGLDTWMHQGKRQIGRKIALIRIMLRKPKIVIVKDTPWIVGGYPIVPLLRREGVTGSIIGISDSLIGCSGFERIVILEKLKVVEDGLTSKFKEDSLSRAGELLRSSQGVSPWAKEEVRTQKALVPTWRRKLIRAIVQRSKADPSLRYA